MRACVRRCFVSAAVVAAAAGGAGAHDESPQSTLGFVDAVVLTTPHLPTVVEIAPASAEEQEEPIAQTLAINEIKIELGYGLLPLINDLEGRRLSDQPI